MSGVSVIIPAFNHARFIAQTLDCVLAQTYPAQEIIVVDDGSTDNTQGTLDTYRNRIRVIYQRNQGPSAARNAGISVSRGEYLLFLDADDLVPPDKLKLQVAALATRPEMALVYSAWQYVDASGEQVLAEMHPQKEGQLLTELLLRAFFFPIAAAVVRRDCVERVGMFDPTLRASEDTDLWMRMARAGFNFGYIDRPLFKYRLVSGSASRNVAGQMKSEFARLDKFFADPALPQELRALQGEAYSILWFESGARHYQIGDPQNGCAHIRQAIQLSPTRSRDENWLLDWIAGFASEPTVQDPHRLIDFVFDHLPPEAATLRSLRQRAHGRYHVAAAFSAHQNHDPKKIRQHVLPALLGDPTIIRNRGFIRIAVQSLLDRRQV